MARIIRYLAAITIFVALPVVGVSQEKSVKPGVNDPFRNPNVAEWVTKFEGESRETYQKRQEIVAACKLKPGMVIADVGAGTGLYTRLFAEEVGKEGTVYAVDISPEFLEHIKASASNLGVTNVRTVLGTDYSVELPEASVDLVFICDTYHHFEYPARMMQSIQKSLKPSGRVVLIDFIRIPGKSSDWVMEHVRAGQELVEKEIFECGFQKTAEIKELLQENYVVVFEKASIRHE
jgi:ubiquinone/menaquinone biosynthesis C-methylase UbiE